MTLTNFIYFFAYEYKKYAEFYADSKFVVEHTRKKLRMLRNFAAPNKPLNIRN